MFTLRTIVRHEDAVKVDMSRARKRPNLMNEFRSLTSYLVMSLSRDVAHLSAMA
jgi:hypothetical protein